MTINDLFLTDWAKWNSAYEARANFMYVDVKGYVTTGVGNALFNPEAAILLDWRHPNGDKATQEQVRSQFIAIRDNVPARQMFYTYQKQFTTIRISEDDIDRLVVAKLLEHHKHLTSQYPEFEAWPLDAQWATHSMAWACGSAFSVPSDRDPYRFVKLGKLLRAKDFAGAVSQCHMNENGNPGLKPRNIANKLMFDNAAYVQDIGMDYGRRYWPDAAKKVWEEENVRDSEGTGEVVESNLGEGPIVHDINSYFPERNRE